MTPEAIITEEVPATNNLNKRLVDDDTDLKMGGNASVSKTVLLTPSSPLSLPRPLHANPKCLHFNRSAANTPRRRWKQ